MVIDNKLRMMSIISFWIYTICAFYHIYNFQTDIYTDLYDGYHVRYEHIPVAAI